MHIYLAILLIVYIIYRRITRSGLAKLFEGACKNCTQVSKELFRAPMGIFKSKIRSWSLPQIIINFYIININKYIINSYIITFLIKTSLRNTIRTKIWQ